MKAINHLSAVCDIFASILIHWRADVTFMKSATCETQIGHNINDTLKNVARQERLRIQTANSCGKILCSKRKEIYCFKI